MKFLFKILVNCFWLITLAILLICFIHQKQIAIVKYSSTNFEKVFLGPGADERSDKTLSSDVSFNRAFQQRVASEMLLCIDSILNENDYAGAYVSSLNRAKIGDRDAEIWIRVIDKGIVKEIVESYDFTTRLDAYLVENYSLLPIRYIPADFSLAQLKKYQVEIASVLEQANPSYSFGSPQINMQKNNILIECDTITPEMIQFINRSKYADLITLLESDNYDVGEFQPHDSHIPSAGSSSRPPVKPNRVRAEWIASITGNAV